MAGLIPNLGNARPFNKRIMNLPGVQRKLDQVARRLDGESKGRLASHRKTGDVQVFTVRDRHTRIIVLSSRSGKVNVMSVQFGHHNYGRWVPGLRILPTGRSSRGSA